MPSFLYLRDQRVDVEGIGSVEFDVAYGGAFYAFVNAQAIGLQLTPEHFDRIIDYGRRIKRAVMNNFPIKHPFEEDLSFLYGTIFTAPASILRITAVTPASLLKANSIDRQQAAA